MVLLQIHENSKACILCEQSIHFLLSHCTTRNQMEMNGRSAGRHRHPRPGSAAGQAADNAVAAMLVWLRREALVEPSAGDDKSQALDLEDERLVRLHVLKLATEACKVPHTLA